MVFLEAETDPFTINQRMILGEVQDAPVDVAVRRPLRGIEIREPTYSYMRVVNESGNLLPFHNTSGAGMDGQPLSASYANYLIQALSFSCTEKFQVVPTFGETYVFFFGQHPIQAQLNGGLLHTPDFPWSEEMWKNYNELIRGTKLAEAGARLYLYYDGVLLEGYPISYQPSQTSDVPNLVPFSMTLLVTSLEMLCSYSLDFPVNRQVIDLADPQAYEQLAQMTEDERQGFLDQYKGAQNNQLNKIRYERERMGLKSIDKLGVLLKAAMSGDIPPSESFQPQLISLDQFMMYGAVGETQRAASPSGWMRDRILPLRSKIYDNTDEYVLRPTESPQTQKHDPDVLDGGQAAEAINVSRLPEDLPTESSYPGVSHLPEDLPPDTGSTFESAPGGPPSHGSTVTTGTIDPSRLPTSI